MFGGRVSVAERDPDGIPTAFHTRTASGVLDQDAAHGFGRRAEEVLAVVPGRVRATEEAQVGFVDERGRLQREVGPLVPETGTRGRRNSA